MERIYVRYTVSKHPYKIAVMPELQRALSTRFEHLIVDSGVNRFFKKMRLQEYPRGYLEWYADRAEWLYRTFGDRVWVVLPDYPSDYAENPIPNNLEKTLKNIERFIDIKANWIIVIQAKYLDIEDYRRALRLYSDILPDYPRIAIGTLCTRAPKRYAVFVTRATRRFFPKSWIHVFGPSLRILPDIVPYIDSIDTAAYYTIPRWLRGTKPKLTEDEVAESWIVKAHKITTSKPKNLLNYLNNNPQNKNSHQSS